MEGITRAVVVPRAGKSLIAGQAALIDLAPLPSPDPRGMVELDPVAMVAVLGSQGAELAGGARGAAMLRLREALEDAEDFAANRKAWEGAQHRDYPLSRLDLDALVPVVQGELLLGVFVNRGSDIIAALHLAREYKLKLVVFGAADGWMVARELAAAKVPVVIDPMTNIPDFESLGATLENAARLAKAGVTVLFASFDAHNSRDLRHAAGEAVAYGMPWDAALRAVTRGAGRGVGDRGSLRDAGGGEGRRRGGVERRPLRVVDERGARLHQGSGSAPGHAAAGVAAALSQGRGGVAAGLSAVAAGETEGGREGGGRGLRRSATTRPAGAGRGRRAPPRRTARFPRASGGSARLARKARIAAAVTRHLAQRLPGGAWAAPSGHAEHPPSRVVAERLGASSGVAVVDEALYLALSSRLTATVVVPLGCRDARRRLSRHNSRPTEVAGAGVVSHALLRDSKRKGASAFRRRKWTASCDGKMDGAQHVTERHDRLAFTAKNEREVSRRSHHGDA